MREPPELLGHDPHQLWVVVTEREHARSGQEVDEDVPVEITDEAAPCLVNRDRDVPRVDPGVGLAPILPEQEFGRARPGKRAGDAGANGYIEVSQHDAPTHDHFFHSTQTSTS